MFQGSSTWNQYFFLWLNQIPLYVWTPFCLSIHQLVVVWASTFCCCEQCCYEHLCSSLNMLFQLFCMYAQECWIIQWTCYFSSSACTPRSVGLCSDSTFNSLRSCPSVSHSGGTILFTPGNACLLWTSTHCIACVTSELMTLYIYLKVSGNSLAVQWLKLCTSTAGGLDSIPGQGTKIMKAVQCGQKEKFLRE